MHIDGVAVLVAAVLVFCAFWAGRGYQVLSDTRGCTIKNPTVGECLNCPDADACEVCRVRERVMEG